MIIMQQDVNLQRRLLHDSFLHPHSRGVSTTVPVAGGRVTPAGGAVPAMVMVTAPVVEADGSAPVAEADGSVPTSSRSGSGEVGGLQMDTVSVQQCQYLMIQKGSTFIPGGLDFLRFPFAHNPTTLRDRRQSFGQLHGWSEGVVPSRLPLGFPFRQGALAFRGVAARQCFGCSSSFCLCRGAGEEGGPVGACRVVGDSFGTTL
jgi:hypothetical protein